MASPESFHPWFASARPVRIVIREEARGGRPRRRRAATRPPPRGSARAPRRRPVACPRATRRAGARSTTASRRRCRSSAAAARTARCRQRGGSRHAAARGRSCRVPRRWRRRRSTPGGGRAQRAFRARSWRGRQEEARSHDAVATEQGEEPGCAGADERRVGRPGMASSRPSRSSNARRRRRPRSNSLPSGTATRPTAAATSRLRGAVTTAPSVDGMQRPAPGGRSARGRGEVPGDVECRGRHAHRRHRSRGGR